MKRGTDSRRSCREGTRRGYLDLADPVHAPDLSRAVQPVVEERLNSNVEAPIMFRLGSQEELASRLAKVLTQVMSGAGAGAPDAETAMEGRYDEAVAAREALAEAHRGRPEGPEPRRPARPRSGAVAPEAAPRGTRGPGAGGERAIHPGRPKVDRCGPGAKRKPPRRRGVGEWRRRESNPDPWALDGLFESPSRAIVGARDGP